MIDGSGISNPFFFLGVVENNVDPTNEGKVQVRAFGVHGTNTVSYTHLTLPTICSV